MKLLSSNKMRLIATLTLTIFTMGTFMFSEPFISKAQAQARLTQICRGKGSICAVLGTAVVTGIGKVLGQHLAKQSIDYLNKETTLKLCNYTISTVYSIYESFDNTTQTWVSRGWYPISPFYCVAINLGKIKNNHIYIYGQSNNLKWGSGSTRTCINTTKKFVIYNNLSTYLNCDKVIGYKSVNTYLYKVIPKQTNVFNFRP